MATAVLDGADCVMLSGETAKGRFPVETIKTMSRICQVAEASDDMWDNFNALQELLPRPRPDNREVLAAAAVHASFDQGAKMIVALTQTGTSAQLLAKHRYVEGSRSRTSDGTRGGTRPATTALSASSAQSSRADPRPHALGGGGSEAPGPSRRPRAWLVPHRDIHSRPRGRRNKPVMPLLRTLQATVVEDTMDVEVVVERAVQAGLQMGIIQPRDKYLVFLGSKIAPIKGDLASLHVLEVPDPE